VKRFALLSAVAASLVACADDTDDHRVHCADCGDEGYGERPSAGMAVVERDGTTKRLTHWEARFIIREPASEGAPHDVEIMLGAEDDEHEGESPDSFGVYIVKAQDLEREPLSLIGSYDMGYVREPSYSGTVTMRWNDRELHSADAVESVGTLTITKHAEGRIKGSLECALDDGSEVTAELDGRISPECWIVAAPDGRTFVEAPLDDPFCAPFFR
jgi:hypothetical protein